MVCVCFLLLPAASAQQSRTLRGTVLDSTSLPIRGAEVESQFQGESQSVATGDNGTFEISVSAGGVLIVRQPGFAPDTIAVDNDSPGDNVEVRLNPASDVQRIVVSGASASDDDRIPAVPSSEYSIPLEEIKDSGSLTLDDVLRQAPGFSLFRRSSSLTANPTSQGVSMRGIGPSGTSRAAVLLDGIPLNDPFGGWVYWTQIPSETVASVQVLNGAASDTYGTGALGGVVNITSRHEQNAYATLETSYGNEDTEDLSFAGGFSVGQWSIATGGQALRTEGYILVPPSLRGSVDIPAGTADLVGTVEVSRKLGTQGRVFLGGTSFGESRENGTPATINNTRIPTFRGGADWASPAAGSFSVRVYGSYEVFHQTFSSVAANRDSEYLVDRQHSPSQQVGFAAQWQRTFAHRNNLTAGLEDRGVRGDSRETTFNASATATANTDAGGHQNIDGFFVQDAYYFAPNWLLTAGGRGDFAVNSGGFMNRLPLAPAGAFTYTAFPGRTQGMFSPRLTLLRTLPHNFSVSASFYRAFRAPTLNELYRNFRVGNIVTDANPALTAESLTGGEAGASLRSWGEKLTLRGDFFWSQLDGPDSNVTIAYSPASCSTNPTSCTTITRERENLGATRDRGFELSADVHPLRRLQISTSYIYTDSTVISAPGNADLVGLRVPEVPKNSFNIQASYVDSKWTVGVQTRYSSNEFDDDQNLLPLGSAFVVDAQVSRLLAHQTQIFFAAQNLLNATYNIAATPVIDVGAPITVRGGFRFNFR